MNTGPEAFTLNFGVARTAGLVECRHVHPGCRPLVRHFRPGDHAGIVAAVSLIAVMGVEMAAERHGKNTVAVIVGAFGYGTGEDGLRKLEFQREGSQRRLAIGLWRQGKKAVADGAAIGR